MKKPYIVLELTEKQTDELSELLGDVYRSNLFKNWAVNIADVVTNKINDAILNPLNGRSNQLYNPVPLYGVKHIVCDKCAGGGSLVVPQAYEKIVHRRTLPE